MKRTFLVGLLSAEALACLTLCILQASFAGVISSAIAFPFEQVGLGLRVLSLSGSAGNGFAIAAYVAVCLLPVAVLRIMRRKRRLRAEDGLLVLLSAVLFAVLYAMINPGVLHTVIGAAAGLSIGKMIAGGMVYSILCGYLVLRILRLFTSGGTGELVRYLSVILGLLNALFVYLIFGAGFGGLLDSFAALRAGNVGNEHLLGISYVFLAMQFIVDALPYAFDMLVVFAALRLLREMNTNRYSAETVAAATQVSRLCTTALVITMLVNMGFNLLQLLFVRSLVVINSSVHIPLFSILFVLGALLLTRLVTENKELKDDNELFV